MTGVIEEVRPLEGFVLEAVFTGGEIRHYDCRALIERYPAFRAMEQDPEIFLHPRIESGGYLHLCENHKNGHFRIFGSATYFICISQVLISHQY